MGHPGEFWERLEDGRVRCGLCPRGCALRPGQAGFCVVRRCVDTPQGPALELASWGRTSGFAVDPVEKKPLYHFLPGTRTLSFGQVGCNMACQFCQNWNISKQRALDLLAEEATPETVAAMAEELGCRSVSFTYNDPVPFFEYARDCAQACRARGLKTVAVTAGYLAEAAAPAFYGAFDAANVDVKAFSERFYHRLCGASLEPVKRGLAIARRAGIWLELTTLLIPGENDSLREIEDLCAWVAGELGPDTPLHFTAFHPDYRMVDRPKTSLSTLRRARDLGLKAGLRHVYTGNLRDPEGGATYCPACGTELILREGFWVLENRLKDGGQCPRCKARVAGVWQ